ncbi:hypothetical protein CBL_09770 [Carabus blaptoides fortunei]
MLIKIVIDKSSPVFKVNMADLRWIPVHMVKIINFNLWCVCDICEQRIYLSDKECCQSTNFIPKFAMTMMVRGPRGELKLISKEMSVLRALLITERDNDWNKWLTAFRLIRMFSYDTSVDVFKGGPACDKELALKQCFGTILRQFGQRPHFRDMKFRMMKSNVETCYYCVMVRPTANH